MNLVTPKKLCIRSSIYWYWYYGTGTTYLGIFLELLAPQLWISCNLPSRVVCHFNSRATMSLELGCVINNQTN